MKDKYPKYLPIGSVVLLENATRRIMITGFCVSPKEDDSKVYDYTGCVYPQGVLSSDIVPVFNHDQIKQIFALGYSDDEEKQFKEKLKESLKQNEQ